MRNILNILKKANDKGVIISYENEKLLVNILDNKEIDHDFLQVLKNEKENLIKYFQNHGSKTTVSSVQKLIRPERIPLSFSQERLWFLDKLQGGSLEYHVPMVLRFHGVLAKAHIEAAFQDVVNRHEVLRTIYLEDEDGKGYQKILPKDKWFLKHITQYLEDEALDTVIINEINAPFDLSKDHMVRATLIRINEDEYVLVLVTHHIASDGWSLSIFINELVAYYQHYKEGKPLNLEPLEIQYGDYSVWQRNYLKGEVLENKLSYWKEKLTGACGVDFPSDYKITGIRSYEGARYSHQINYEVLRGLKQVCQHEEVTLFMILLASFKVLLYRYSGQDDITIASPIANRSQAEIETLIGFFLNPLVLRSDLSGTPEFKELLHRVKKTLLGAYIHQDIPYEKVIGIIEDERNLNSRSAIQDIVFVLQNTEKVADVELDELQLFEEPISEVKVDYNLHFSAQETSEGINFVVTYSKELYALETIERFMKHYENILKAIIKNPTTKIHELEMLTKQDISLLNGFNDTKTNYNLDQTVVDLFEEQVEKTPNNIALIDGNSKYTYKELNVKANQLAHYLRSQYKVKPNDLIGIMMNRSEWMIISILGILKSGAAYVPIDIDYPESRKQFIIEDSGLSLMLINSESLFDILEFETQALSIDIEFESIPNTSEQKRNPLAIAKSNHLVYAIYTSGSTGKPKGVMIEHSNLVNTILDQKERIEVTENDCLSQFVSLTFDVSCSEIFTSLVSGASLLLLSVELIKNGENFIDYLQENKVSVVSMPSSYLMSLTYERLGFLRALKVGGEVVNINIVLKCAKNIDVYNEYGLTECTIVSSIYKIKASDEDRKQLPIGKPIANTEIFILGNHEELLPVGVVGELCISGAGLSRGYINNGALNREKFIHNPYREGELLYKTGDLARWLPDGNIDFIGRKDYQVKIRGNRIELGEIETVLQNAPHIIQAVVLVRESEILGKRLVGYITTEEMYDKATVQSFLEERLPQYMLPSLLVELETMPLNQNGKIDRKQIPEADLTELKTTSYVAPISKTEMTLVNLWEDLLNVSKVGIDDNFFELGGDSIITIQLVSRAKREGYYFTPKDAFENQTIRLLANFLENKFENEVVTEQGLLHGSFELTPVQNWFFDNEFPEMAHYNQSLLLDVTKKVSRTDLVKIIDILVDHHDAFRLQFEKKEGKWEQYYTVQNGELVYESIQTVSKEKLSETITEICNRAQKSLALDGGDLVRFVFIETPENENANRLFIAAHHLVIDAVSWRILLDDLGECLTQLAAGKEFDLGQKGSSYRQFNSALIKYAESEAMETQISYWKNVANGLLKLPVDMEGEKSLLKDVEHFNISLSQEVTKLLIKEANKAYNTEINDLLLSGLASCVGAYFNTSKVMVGLEGHGREDIFNAIDVTGTIGWFTSFYPLQIDINTVRNTSDLIKSTKEQLRLIPDKGMGYGVLRYFHPSEEVRETLANVPWDIGFNYFGQFDNTMSGGTSEWLIRSTESIGENLSPQTPFRTRLEINCSITGGQLHIVFGYSPREYQQETIVAIAEGYIQKLQEIVQHCCEKGGVDFTPADYGLNGKIDYKELEEFLESDEIEGDEILKF
ncbi:non-ribosomal peptide synthetase [Snuella sedimenti]|uniref:Amino acid adenylation domain-containing protein n=1 Tax=Snuella sedimenti TaxID=2798802 RepID=A0A8J7J4H8_9FLAO|nr:non-ribosomal peptide synthetase [Snuella sedimenti]MBJ6369742.1 amino acid adenylation domain-containing protein [Snuella sedimenti]